MKFGEFIVNARVRNDLTLREASLVTKIDVGRLSDLEREVSPQGPTPEELLELVKAYGVEENSFPKYVYDHEKHKQDQEHWELMKNSRILDL